MNIFELPQIECRCKSCLDGCLGRPGWAIPDEIRVLIKSGYKERLMVDWYASDIVDGDVFFLCPAIAGYEQQRAPMWPIGRCTFFTNDQLCEIHKIKPFVCKVINGHDDMDKPGSVEIAEQMIALWNNPEEQAFVRSVFPDASYDTEPTTSDTIDAVLGSLGITPFTGI